MKNATTNKGYSANNEAMLYDAMCEMGFESELVAGYGQWQQAGRQVRKGETGTQIKRIIIKKEKCKKTGKLVEKKIMKTLVLFFLEQTDEKGAEQSKPLSSVLAESLFRTIEWDDLPEHEKEEALGLRD
jgi:antirestriction protein ArdC